jgi:potassium/chloride transporter 4/5/6
MGLTAKQSLKHCMEKEKVKGFAEVVISKDITQGLAHCIQTAGLFSINYSSIITINFI